MSSGGAPAEVPLVSDSVPSKHSSLVYSLCAGSCGMHQTECGVSAEQHGNHTLLYVDDVACTEALFQLLGGSIASHELGQTVVAAKAAVLTCTVLLEGRKEAAGAWSSL